MSNIVLVNAGQCGNQLGYSMLRGAYKELASDDGSTAAGTDGHLDSVELDILFRQQSDSKRAPLARCVCLDTEPKAGIMIGISYLQRNTVLPSKFMSISYGLRGNSKSQEQLEIRSCISCVSTRWGW
jgi:hypothetical protein